MAEIMHAILLHRNYIEKYMEALTNFEIWTQLRSEEGNEIRLICADITEDELKWLEKNDKEIYLHVKENPDLEYIILW